MSAGLVRFDLEKFVLIAVAGLVVVIGLLLFRGAGFGLGDISWSSNLVVERSNLRLGNILVQPGDQVLSVNGSPVSRDADLRGQLRASDSPDVWLQVSRDDYEIAVPLTPQAIELDELPATLRGPYTVVAIDDRRIQGAMNLQAMSSWMRQNGGRPSVFTVSVPDYTFEGAARRVERAVPILPMVLLIFTTGTVVLSWMRGRAEVMFRRRQHWYLLGLALVAGGVLLAFLTWYDGFMADPVLLPVGLIALACWRPLSLFLHQDQRGELTGTPSRFFRLVAALPATILLLASVYGWTRTFITGTESYSDGLVFDQLGLLVLIAAAAATLYHAADTVLQSAYLRRNAAHESLRSSPPWIAMMLGWLAVVGAAVSASQGIEAFVSGGFVPIFAILVGVQWLGDMALLPRRMVDGPQLMMGEGDTVDLAQLLESAADSMALQRPLYVCRFEHAAAVLSCVRVVSEVEEQPDGHRGSALPGAAEEVLLKLVVEPLDERLSGLLDLLDAEGGMFPRYKTIRGGDEIDDDPFDGLDVMTGVELVLEIEPPGMRMNDDGMRAHLVSRKADTEAPLPMPDVELIDQWLRRFSNSPRVWSELVGAAARGALSLAQNEREIQTAVDPDLADFDGDRARLHYLASDDRRRYPIDESELIPDALGRRLKTFAKSAGPMAIVGPHGSGRGFCARAIHELSGRTGPFMTLDCARLPASLVLLELSGADDLPGRLDAVGEGTLLIRRLAVLEPQIQERVIEAVRESAARPIFTERDPDALPPKTRHLVDEAVLSLAPLSERPETVEAAAYYFLHNASLELDRVIVGLSDAALELLKSHPLPSNFYTLRQLIYDAASSSDADELRVDDFGLSGSASPARTAPAAVPVSAPSPTEAPSLADADDLAQHLEDVERAVVFRALSRSGGNKSQAARLLGMKRTTFIRKLSKYQELG